MRRDVVENPVIPEGELVYGCRCEDVRLSDGRVAGMVDNALIASEGVRFGKERRCATWHVRSCLIVAEAGKQAIRARKGVVQPNVELGLIQRTHGLALEVVSVYVIARSGQGIKPDQLLSNRIPQPLRDHIARLALILLSGGRTDKGHGLVGSRYALKKDIVVGYIGGAVRCVGCRRSSAHIWVGDYKVACRQRIAKVIGAEIALAHRCCRN